MSFALHSVLCPKCGYTHDAAAVREWAKQTGKCARCSTTLPDYAPPQPQENSFTQRRLDVTPEPRPIEIKPPSPKKYGDWRDDYPNLFPPEEIP